MLLDKITSPADVKSLDEGQLGILADEIRQGILNRVSHHGGHVGPDLGFVEATIALHRVFDAPTDSSTMTAWTRYRATAVRWSRPCTTTSR